MEAQARQEKREALEAEREGREDRRGRDDRRSVGGGYGDTRTGTRGYSSGTAGLYGAVDSLYGGASSQRMRGSDRTTGRYSDGRTRRRGDSENDLERRRELLARKKELSMGPTIDDVYAECSET